MRPGAIRENERGFTLIEVLMVAAILGLVIVSIMSLFQGTQRNAYTQEEVVDVQQNLRIGVDQIARDLRFAGFMIPAGTAPLVTALPNSLTLNTASPFGHMARIDDTDTTPGSADIATYNTTLTIGAADMADFFEIDHNVRIVRPPNQTDLFGLLNVSGKDRTDPSISLDEFGAGDEDVEIQPGDIIARVPPDSSGDFPNTVTYAVSGDQLTRAVNYNSAQVVADKVSRVEFHYLLDNDNTPYNSIASGSLDDIRAVQVTLFGETVDTATEQYGTGYGPDFKRERELSNTVTLRNR